MLALVAALVCGSAGWASTPPGLSGWVELDGQKVLELRSAAGAQNPERLARHLSTELTTLAKDYAFNPDQLITESDPPYVMVGIRESNGRIRPLLAVDDRAADLAKVSKEALATRYRDQLSAGIKRFRLQHSPGAWLRGTAVALLVLLGYVLLLRATSRLNRQLRAWLHQNGLELLPELQISGNQLVPRESLRNTLQLARVVVHWGAVALFSYLLVPLLLSFFPPTMALAAGLRSQMLGVISTLGGGLVALIPNLLTLIFIGVIAAVTLRLSQRFFAALEQEQLRFSWFYPEWAKPTSRIATILIAVASFALALPYIPGSTSKVFQGAGVFLGILAALGSSAITTNVLSGLMLIYTRGFREGDRVNINGVIGIVQERALLVTRIVTPLNELVSIPNATVIASPVLNYSLSARELNTPVALGISITIGYDVPWRQVHQLMLDAASKVPEICPDPKPVVVQTSLNDFHVSYELNAYITNVPGYRKAYSDLLGAIQDAFAHAGVEILSPAYEANRDGNPSTVPPV
jgi:small-conductance mechanosensitive channel